MGNQFIKYSVYLHNLNVYIGQHLQQRKFNIIILKEVSLLCK